MAIKKIIDIDVNDEKFLRFLNAYADLDAAMDKAPEKMKRLEGIFSGLNSGADRLGRGSVKFFKNIGSEALRINGVFKKLKFSQILFTSEIGRTSAAMKVLLGITNAILGTVKKLTGAIGVGIIGGVGITSLLSRLSGDVIKQRFEARSVGLGTGDVKAFEASHGAIFGGEEGASSFLSTAARSQATPEGIATLSNLGINANQRADLVANQLIGRINAEFQRLVGSGATQFQALQVMQARTLGIIPIEQIRAIGNATPKEIEQASKDEGSFKERTAINDQSAEKWATFWTSITSTLSQVQNSILSVLSEGKMLLSIQGAITSAGSAIIEWIRGDAVRRAMETFGKFISDTVAYLRSQKFADAVKDFVDSVILIGHKIKSVTSFFSWDNWKKNKEDREAQKAKGKTNFSKGHTLEHEAKPEPEKADINLFKGKDIKEELKEKGYLTNNNADLDNLHIKSITPENTAFEEEGKLINNFSRLIKQLPPSLNDIRISSYLSQTGSSVINDKHEKLNVEPLPEEQASLKQSIVDFAKPSFKETLLGKTVEEFSIPKFNETNLGKTTEQFPLPTEETAKNPISEQAIYWAVYRGMLDAFTAMPNNKLTSIPPNSRIGIASHAAGL